MKEKKRALRRVRLLRPVVRAFLLETAARVVRNRNIALPDELVQAEDTLNSILQIQGARAKLVYVPGYTQLKSRKITVVPATYRVELPFTETQFRLEFADDISLNFVLKLGGEKLADGLLRHEGQLEPGDITWNDAGFLRL